ncbi:hypothetical protein [Pseudomonas sp. P8_250]|uniref:hypothetical protein n=1 Tax=Pseudomonas sp. P8_250 TaxID=3043446 RepID=UPI002A36F1A0|nr:hypothetical protein [Pseudomonas sp. P8_250]MDX9668713.1 hypothetical protein [Pseudomonas sp. P8_250]
MNRDRAAWLKDRVRALAQGAVGNIEIIWQDWAENLTPEEFKICHTELESIAAKINKTRTFASREVENEDDQQDQA